MRIGRTRIPTLGVVEVEVEVVHLHGAEALGIGKCGPGYLSNFLHLD